MCVSQIYLLCCSEITSAFGHFPIKTKTHFETTYGTSLWLSTFTLFNRITWLFYDILNWKWCHFQNKKNHDNNYNEFRMYKKQK